MSETEKQEHTGLSRRDFMKGAAVATGAGLLAGCAPKVVDTSTISEATTVPTAKPTTVAVMPTAAPDVKIGTATVKGHGGDISVTLSIKENKIIDCQIIGDYETPDHGGKAVALMPAQYIEKGNLNVDGVAGATVTSTAIKSGASMAWNNALGITPSNVKMKPGAYTASALGHWGIWKLPVTITVSDTALLKIEVPEERWDHGETEIILQSVKDRMFPRMIEHQSVVVDAIAGATVSSDAVKVSVEAALKEALIAGGSDESAIQHFYKAPPKIEEGITEEKDVDIVVVGLGGGGIMALLSAMQTIQSLNGNRPVSVLGIDRAGKFGGKSALAHEGNAVNPPNYVKTHNDGNPFVDAVAYEKKWLEFATGKDGVMRAKPELIQMFIKESGKTIDWMYDQCYRFGSMKFSEMSDGAVAFNAAIASGIDPGTYEDRRKAVNNYYKQMLATVIAQGGEYLLETEGYEYIMDGDKVVGIKARNLATGKEYIIHAKAVIQGTGGFDANDEMMSTLIDPRWAGPRKRVGTDQATGKMMQAALDIGAGTWNIEMSPIVMTIGLPHYLTHYPINEDREKGLLPRTGRYRTWTYNDIPLGMGMSSYILGVDKKGERFDDENKMGGFATDIYHDSFTSWRAGVYYLAIYSQDRVDEIAEKGFPAGTMFGSYLQQGGMPTEIPVPEVYNCLDICIAEDMAWKGDTIEELAIQLDMDPDVLKNTIETYNKYCEMGVDEQFGKDPQFLKKLEKGPYYAIKMMNAPFATCGGLDVDTQIRVLRDDHVNPIPGLYAIGIDSFGVLVNNERNYIGFTGVAQGWYNTSGRLAGKYAAEYVNESYGLKDVGYMLEPPEI